MTTPRHQDDTHRAAGSGTTDYDARRDGTVHTESTASRTKEFDAARTPGDRTTTTSTRSAADPRRDHSTATRRNHTGTADATRRSASQKGLWIGVLTFLALAVIDWLAGPSLSTFESLTFGEVIVYAIVGVIVGVIVKQIDLRRHRNDATHAHRA
jgi:hypothetical protein